jgi:phage terminase small subunit
MRDWWAQVVGAYELAPHHLLLLESACRAWDRMQEARAVLAKKGLTYVDDRANIRQRPEVAIEQASHARFLRALRDLGLDDEAPRPPEPYTRPSAHRRSF